MKIKGSENILTMYNSINFIKKVTSFNNIKYLNVKIINVSIHVYYYRQTHIEVSLICIRNKRSVMH